MDIIKNNYKIIISTIFVFILTLFSTLIVIALNIDEIWNYGFSYNIYNGLVPYKDFNMVITPFFPFLMSLPFHIFGSNILVFHIEWALIISFLFAIIYKTIGEKTWLFMIFLFFPIAIIIPNYNIFLFVLLVIILYLENENNDSDILIGILLSLAFLTKHSVGLFLLLPSLYYISNKRKIIKRFIGFIIPICLFVIYLIYSNSYKEFIDLCILGLFDFASENPHLHIIIILLSFIMFIVTIIYIKKSDSKIEGYYTLSFYSIIFPLFDLYHFQVALLAFAYFILKNIKIVKIRPFLLFIGVYCFISLVYMDIYHKHEIIYPNKLKHFEYRMINNDGIKITNRLNRKIRKYKNVVHIHSNAYFLRIVNDQKIGYIDLINNGNWGYNGSKKMLRKIKKYKNKDVVFIVNKYELSIDKQTNKEVMKYIIKNAKKIDSVYYFDIYKFK